MQPQTHSEYPKADGIRARHCVKCGACFTCIGLADGLTGTVEFAFSVGVEEPLALETRTPFRSASRLFALNRSGARVEGCLGTFALLDCSQYAV